MTDDLNIPDFLNRTETEEQADARRKKYAPKDGSAGLKVKKPPEPVDPKIAKAIARDLKEPKSSGGLQILASMLPAVGDAKPDWQKTQDSLRKAEKEQHAKPAKKAGKLVERAMKARDALAAAAAAKKTNGSPAAKPAKAPAKTSGSKKQSKVDLIAGLLKRKEGCTTADVLKATGWPSVSMPAQAKAADLKLTKKKVDGVYVYHGA